MYCYQYNQLLYLRPYFIKRYMGTLNLSRSELQLARGRIRPMFLRYAMPGVIAMLFMALQAMVDGWIIGRLICADALAAVNIAMPTYVVVTAFAVIIGVGTQAQVGLHMGGGDYVGAKRALWSGAWGLAIFAIIGTLIINLFAEPMLALLGANEELMHHAVGYVHGVMPWLVGITALLFFDYQLKALGHPRVAMIIMTSTIVLNTALSVFFVGHLGMGTFGAGLGTGVSFTIGAAVYAIYFLRILRRNGELHRAKGRFSLRTLWHICYNGSSEGATEVAVAITTFLFNITLMEYAGKSGVAAFTLINNILYFGICIALGVSNGIVPIISYNYGAKQYLRVQKVTRLAIKTNLLCGVFFIALLSLFGRTIVGIFISPSETAVLDIASHGAIIASLAFLFNGLNIYVSSYFTAIDRPDLSLLVAALRGIVFLAPLILLLPRLWGIDGIWITTPIAELATAIVAVTLMIRHSKKSNI